MSKKDLIEHETQCELIEWTCTDCGVTVKKNEMTRCHTDIMCLQEQLRNVRQYSEDQIHRLEGEVRVHKNEVHKLREDCAEHTRKLNAYRKITSK